MKYICFFYFYFLLCTNIFAQKDIIPEVDIQEVIIRENRIQIPLSQKPSNLVIIDLKSIDHSAVQSVADLLHYIAGVDIRQRGSNGIQSDVGIRGSSFDQVLILVNGIKMSDPQTGHHSFNLPIDISNVDHIEIYKGSSARVFGQNAFAGAINIITKIPTEEFIRLQSIVGDFGLLGGNLSLSLPGDKIKSSISVSNYKSSGYKYNTDYSISNIYYQSELSTGYGTINLLSGFSSKKFGANGFYSSPEFRDQYENIQTSLVSLGYSPVIKNRMLKLKNRIYWRRNRDEYLFIRNDPSYYRNLHINNTVGLDVNLTYQNNLGVTGIGIDLNIPWLTSSRLGERSRRAATVLFDHRISLLNGDLNIIPGIQINLFSDFENNILPGIDLGYSISPALMAFINSGYTFRVPTYTDLYYEDPVNSSNPDLQPEYAFSNELGLKTIKINGIAGQLSYFSRKNLNLIDRSKQDINDKWKPENIGEVKMDGIDFNLSFQPATFFGNNEIFIRRLDLGYTFINSRVTGSLPVFSKFVMENLKNQLTVGIELKYFRNFYQTVNIRYNDRANMADYTITDTRLGWDSGKFSLYTDITNILDVVYKESSFVTLPGRWVKIGAVYKINIGS
jgi:vitamin B12 transporter